MILVVKDAASTVQRAIESVLDQSGVRIELVVVDGASSDSTVVILHRFRDRIARLFSEPDNGIADAMNKGLAASRGDWIYFLGADDRLAGGDAIASMFRLAAGRQANILAGSVVIEDSAGRSRRLDPRGFGFGANFKTPLLHQGVLCRRTLFDRIGDFDRSLRIGMDYDFFLRAHRRGESIVDIDSVVAVMDGRGVGSRTDWPSLSRRIREERVVHLRHCNSFLLRLLYTAYHPTYFLYRRLRAWIGA